MNERRKMKGDIYNCCGTHIVYESLRVTPLEGVRLRDEDMPRSAYLDLSSGCAMSD